MNFALTHLCMNTELLREFMNYLVGIELTRRISVIASTAILSSAEDARWLRKHRPNAMIPESVIARLEAASDPLMEGVAICSEQLRELAAIPGVDGANIMDSTDLSKIPDAVTMAQLDRL